MLLVAKIVFKILRVGFRWKFNMLESMPEESLNSTEKRDIHAVKIIVAL